MRLKNISKSFAKGASIVELTAGLLISIPILLAVLNCVMLAVGLQFNEMTCREAARIAATGEPASAEVRAQTIVLRANEEKTATVDQIRLISVSNTFTAADMTRLKANGGSLTGTVTVITAADVRPFFANWLPEGRRILTFQTQQTFPYTYVVPNKIEVNE